MILITGGAGFIGSHLAERLQKKGIRILDNLSTGNLRNIEGINVDFVKGDIKRKNVIESAMQDVNDVFHLAANVFPTKSIRNPLFDLKTNIESTLNLLETARKKDIEHFIFSSSCAIYGDTKNVPIAEDTPTVPKSPYGVGKLACEHYMRVYNELYGMKTMSLRYFNVYGERQNPRSQYSGVISKFLYNVQRGVPLEIHGDGSQMRDFIYVKDVVEANMLALKSQRWGMPLNIGTGKSISILTLAKIILKEKNVGLIHREERKGDIRISVADTRLAKKMLGFRAKVSLSDGMSSLLKSIADDK